MYGLKMKKEYLDLILTGKRTTDVRTYPTELCGRIALVCSEDNLIHGYVNLMNVSEITFAEYVYWHVTEKYTKDMADAYLKENPSGRICYSYHFENLEVLSFPQKAVLKDHDKSFVFIDEESILKPYMKQHLF